MDQYCPNVRIGMQFVHPPSLLADGPAFRLAGAGAADVLGFDSFGEHRYNLCTMATLQRKYAGANGVTYLEFDVDATYQEIQQACAVEGIDIFSLVIEREPNTVIFSPKVKRMRPIAQQRGPVKIKLTPTTKGAQPGQTTA